MEPAIGDGAGVLPGAEHRGNRAPELSVEVLRERRAELGLDELLEAGDEVGPILGGEFGVELDTFQIFVVLEDLLEQLVVEAEHHVGIHLNEAAIGIVGEAPVAGAPRQTLHGPVVETEIEHGIHHARHRGARTRAHRDEQRIVDIAELGADTPADFVERRAHQRLQLLRELAAKLVIDRAEFRGDGEARRNRQAEPRHLGEIGTLAAEPVALGGRTVGAACAEAIDPFR